MPEMYPDELNAISVFIRNVQSALDGLVAVEISNNELSVTLIDSLGANLGTVTYGATGELTFIAGAAK